MLIASLLHDNILQLPCATMTTHEKIIMGMDNYLVFHDFPMRPIKMNFFKMVATFALKEETIHEHYIFIIYLILIGLIGIMSFYSIVNGLELPLNNLSWVLTGASFRGKKTADDWIKQNSKIIKPTMVTN